VSDINEQLTALKEEVARLEEERYKALMEFGEKALPELRGKADFSEDAAKLDELEASIKAKGEEEIALLAEKEKQEAEERERILKLTCFSCNIVNPEGAMFCENCGSKLGEPPREYCKNCGFMNQPGMMFCGKCGSKLDEEA